jgi:predicted dehydrogenase
MPVNWGILSTAHINRLLIPGVQESPEAEVIAVGSRELARAQEFASRWGIERSYGSYEEVLSDPDVDAVYIPLPNTMHCEWSIRAMEAGKHVLCEKPLSSHLGEVEAAFDVSERTGRLLSEAFMYRHNPQTAKLKELVDGGAVGEVRLIRSAFSYSLHDPENIRLRTDVEGGSLMDVGCYCVSGSRLLAGEPTSAAGQQFTGPTGTDWVFTAIMRFPGDVLATFDCGTTLPDREELEVVGSHGSLFLPDPWHCVNPVIEVRRDGGVERIELEPVNSYRLEVENLGAAARGEEQLLLGRDDAVQQARVIEALFQSSSSGSSVSLI